MFLIRYINHNGKYATRVVHGWQNAEYFLDWLENVKLQLLYIAEVSNV